MKINKLVNILAIVKKLCFFIVNENIKTIIERKDLPSPNHQPGVLPEWINDQQVNFVLVTGIEECAKLLFEKYKIKVIDGITETIPEKAILNFLNIELITDPNPCDH